MTNVPYNTNIPFASNSPSQDQPRMQENTNSLKSLIEIDHVGFGNNQGGYHTVIHQATQTSVNTVPGVNQIFSGVPGILIVDGVVTPAIPANGDVQLYSLTGQNPTGGRSQLTGNSALQDGYQWIGGMLLQWGKKTGGGAVVFPITFPNALLNVTATLFHLSPTVLVTVQSVSIDSNPTTFTTAGFSFQVTPAIGLNLGFYWMAIGN